MTDQHRTRRIHIITPVPTDAAGVTSEADARVRPGCVGERSRASGLPTRGRGAPLPLRVLKRPEAESPLAPVGSSSNTLRDRRGDFSTFSGRTILHAIGRLRARLNLRNYPLHKSTNVG